MSAADLLAFIAAAPSPYHAVAEAARRLDTAGYTQVDESAPWSGGGRQYIVRGGSLVAWDAGPSGPDGGADGAGVGIDVERRGFRIVGAHTDSPNLRVKPQPDAGRAGWSQLAVEVYGGPLVNSWLDRDLGLSGRVTVRSSANGGTETRLLLVDEPVLRIPQLAIHLDRDVNVVGLVVNPQQQLVPVWALGGPDAEAFRRFVAKRLDIDGSDVLAWDVMTHDTTPGCVSGRDGEFISSGRLDNLCSCWAAVSALAAGGEGRDGSGPIPVIALFDHEEVGSSTDRGAASPILETVLERIALAGGGSREDVHRALAQSVCVSVDMAHAVHPNYVERYDPSHQVIVNGGPAIKHNVSARYATEAPTAAVFLDACERAGVPVQHYVHRNDMVCGSTIGPLTATRLGVPTVDVGAPQLAMHSARELMGSADPDYLHRALEAFFTP